MKPRNMLFVMSDEHNPRVLGCGGHPVIRTPNLDRLAASGVRFTDAYCNSPICVPSRASFHTGRYVHEIRYWDNAIAYDGRVPTWGHRLQQSGHRVDSIGKLHFKHGDTGSFSKEHIPLHIVDQTGDPLGMLRDPPLPRRAALKMATDAKRGDSSYQDYDQDITTRSVAWLKERAAKPDDKPWCLFVSLVCPHFPMISRPEWFDLYADKELPWPLMYAAHERPRHPYIEAMRKSQMYDDGFGGDPALVRKVLTAYFGMVSYVDDNVGKLMRALEETGLADNTRIVYTSDHGDNLGTRGLWGKSNMYEESAGIPMLMAGPDVPQGVVCREPVTLVDAFPTITQCVGAAPAKEDATLPGTSLLDVVAGKCGRRTVMSEYHAAGSATGVTMIRHGRFKYIHYVGMPPMLFDLEADPHEKRDLGEDPGFAGLRAECEARVRKIVDPAAADRQARADQAARIAELGGREAIIKRGSFGYSPPPGTKAVYTA